MLVHYQSHLIATELFAEYSDAFKFNSISIKNHVSFVNHLDDIELIISTGYITVTSPANTGLVDNFKVAYSPADSFKNSIKRDTSLLTTFKEGAHWDA